MERTPVETIGLAVWMLKQQTQPPWSRQAAALLQSIAADMTMNPDVPGYGWDEALELAAAVVRTLGSRQEQ